jgi:hypothetical protein
MAVSDTPAGTGRRLDEHAIVRDRVAGNLDFDQLREQGKLKL